MMRMHIFLRLFLAYLCHRHHRYLIRIRLAVAVGLTVCHSLAGRREEEDRVQSPAIGRIAPSVERLNCTTHSIREAVRGAVQLVHARRCGPNCRGSQRLQQACSEHVAAAHDDCRVRTGHQGFGQCDWTADQCTEALGGALGFTCAMAATPTMVRTATCTSTPSFRSRKVGLWDAAKGTEAPCFAHQGSTRWPSRAGRGAGGHGRVQASTGDAGI